MKYRKKPVVIEAFRWMIHEVPDWWVSAKGVMIEVQTGCAIIPTLEGEMRAQPGDWIIKGVLGELYPCKPDAFEKSHEKI